MITIPDIIIAIMALCGVVIATITLVRQIRRGKINIKVQTSTAVPVHNNGTFGDDFYCFTASNHGLRNITLSHFGMYVPKTKTHLLIIPPSINVYMPTLKFPYELAPGTSCNHYIEVGELKRHFQKDPKGSVKLEPYFMDALDNKHSGKYITLSITLPI